MILGAVKSHVKSAAIDIEARFNPSSIIGVGYRANESDHPSGHALDFMIGNDMAKGDQIANHLVMYKDYYGIKYVIWKQHIWSTGRASEGWRKMENRGSATANHLDHVHASFVTSAQFQNIDDPLAPGPLDKMRPEDEHGIGPGNPLAGIQNALRAIGDAVKWITDPHNWLRVGMFVLGALLILGSLILLATRGGKVGKVANAIR